MAVPCEALRAKHGGADRDQTDDLVIANDALYQLSYSPVLNCFLKIRLRRVNIILWVESVSVTKNLRHRTTWPFICFAQ